MCQASSLRLGHTPDAHGCDLEKLSFLGLFRNTCNANRKVNEDHSKWQVGKPAFLKWEDTHTQLGHLSLALLLSLGPLSTRAQNRQQREPCSRKPQQCQQ